jgi:hypothetical protein
MALKAVCIAAFVRKSYSTGILNRLLGDRSRQRMAKVAGLRGLIPLWIGMRCGWQEVVAVFQIDPDSSPCRRVGVGLAYPDAANGAATAAVSGGL